jgi:hypothetical protein
MAGILRRECGTMNIMQLTRSDVEAIAYERGYESSEIQGCFIKHIHGDLWEVDVDHKEYPKPSDSRTPRMPLGAVVDDGVDMEILLPPKNHVAPANGPGTELKKLLAGWPFYITSSPDCSCNRVVIEMNSWGADECERPERVDYILAAMRSNAEKRGLPFLDAAGRFLIRRAIKNARKNKIDQ